LIATCSSVMPMPIVNSEVSAIEKLARVAKRNEPASASSHAPTSTGFAPNLSRSIPAGIDITPYAMKNENGRKLASARLNAKPLMMSGTSGPRMLVMNEITKKMRNTSNTIGKLRFMPLLPSPLATSPLRCSRRSAQ
jgi:hypothetical protein